MFERIVVAVDGSDAAKHALNVACNLADKYDAEVHLVHTPQIETTGLAVGSGSLEIKPSAAEVEAAGRQVTDEAENIVAAGGTKLRKTIIGNSDPASDILKAIGTTNADLVVMGRRGLGNLSSLLLGSVSQKVSQGAKCTCMTVC